ncbi:hypothetical protein BJV82DRAFT_605238 [Fennellomyces sp. T-0311]|nr:hypothetical protein BJV82DRAFT_605238 [Fennellomyces sp. T-0311]
MSSTSALFKPIKIGSTQLEHRIVLAPLTRRRSDKNHVPTTLQQEYYAQRATKGGMLITEGVLISPMAGGYRGAPGIYSDQMIQGWKKITDAVHAKGGFIYMQLWHVGRATGSVLLPNNAQPVSASPIAIKGPNTHTDGSDFEVPHALTVEEIAETVQDYVQAAKNAITAGFDGVEIHGANGYLLDQFINSISNQRTDQYGGSIANRARFILETVAAVSQSIGAERVGIRMSPWSEFQDVEDETPYETWGYIIDKLQEHHPDLAYVHMVEPRDDFARKTRNDTVNSLDPFRAKWKGTFISAGGYTTNPALAAQVADKTGNMIAIGRAFIANPDLVYRLKHGLPLNKYNRATFYSEGPVGYTDYPFAEEVEA